MYGLRWYCWAILNSGRFGDLRTIYQGCRALPFALAGLSCRLSVRLKSERNWTSPTDWEVIYRLCRWMSYHVTVLPAVIENGKCNSNSISAHVLHHIHSVILKPTVSTRPSVLPSGCLGSLRFSLWPTLCTLKDFIYLLTYLLTLLLTHVKDWETLAYRLLSSGADSGGSIKKLDQIIHIKIRYFTVLLLADRGILLSRATHEAALTWSVTVAVLCYRVNFHRTLGSESDFHCMIHWALISSQLYSVSCQYGC